MAEWETTQNSLPALKKRPAKQANTESNKKKSSGYSGNDHLGEIYSA